MQNEKEIKAMIQTVKVIVRAMKIQQIPQEDIENVRLAVEEVNLALYHAKALKFQKIYDSEAYSDYVKELERLVEIWEQTIQHRAKKAVDVEFWKIYEYFKYVDTDFIYAMTVQRFLSLPEGLRLEYLSLPHRYRFLQAKIDVTRGDYSLIRQHVEMMAENVEKYRWLYERLADYRSKMVLNGVIRYWFQFDLNRLHALCETVFSDYFDLDILACGKDEVVVDLGAYTGDTVRDYINTYGEYQKIYAYELTPSTYETLVRNVSDYSNVIPVQKGVSSKSGVMYVENIKNGGGNKILESGDTPVEIVTLDEDIKEPVTLIKMDVEGAEKDAIKGAADHIRSDRPKLLISSYHLPEDIFEVPCLIDSIRDDYTFYMRFNGHNGLWPCDYVLFAV